jgi:hypothetical protein
MLAFPAQIRDGIEDRAYTPLQSLLRHYQRR